MTSITEEKPDTAMPDEQKQAWRRAGLLFALSTALLFALYFETVATMVKTWLVSDTYGYGLVILPIVLFLFYQRRRNLARLSPRPCFWAVIWIAGAMLLQLVGAIANITLFEQLGFVAAWQGLFVLYMGWPIARQAIFALFYLALAVPVGAEVVPTLQTITAEITVPLLRASGIPTFHDGIFIQIPTGSFVVAEVCSGARFLITSVALGALATNIFFRSWRRRCLFMLLCVVVPVLANGLRAYGIILLAHLTDSDTAIAFDHIIYGLIFLSLVLLILIGLGSLFRDRWPGEEALEAVALGAGARPFSSLGALLLAIVLLGGGNVWTRHVTAAPPAADPVALDAPLAPDGWRISPHGRANWDPAFPGADSQLLQAYRAPEGEVVLFVAHYLYQRDGHEVITAGNSVAGKSRDLQVTRYEPIEITLAGRRQTIREILVQTPEGPRLIWSWYEIGGALFISGVAGKTFEIWHTVSGGSRAATAFALSTMVEEDARRARAVLETFLSALETNRGLAIVPVTPDKPSTAEDLAIEGSQ